jgi:NAD(P)-dependent dehydrogenase (short-subunit alcohol dehydrogenase family)
MHKTALITGAAKRIGKSIALHLAENGWNVAVHFNTSAKQAEELAEELKSKFPGQQFMAFGTDLANIDEVLNLIPAVIEVFGPFQFLINNASVFNQAWLTETSPDLYDAQMNVNLRAPFFLMRDFARFCKNGNIVNFADTRVTSNKSDFAAYSLSKKGLWELTKMAALEWAPNIRVNAIAPGATLAPADKDDNYLQALAQNIPMKRPGGVQPILKSLDYILANEHLTGQLLFADGGENLGKNR